MVKAHVSAKHWISKGEIKMDNKNELSDIVLEKSDEKILKAKRVLIIISILIIVFLIVLLSMKLLNRSDNEKTPNLILPPEPTTAVKEADKDSELFKQVPIIKENTVKKDNINNIVKNLKDKAAKENTVVTSKEKNTVVKVPKKEEIKTVVKPIVQHIAKKTKPVVKKTKIKHANTKITKGIYVQVGATSKLTPSKKFLKKIKSEKFSYKLLPINIKGKKITKILVGPFKNRQSAKQNLVKIKKSLNKHAFIYMMK